MGKKKKSGGGGGGAQPNETNNGGGEEQRSEQNHENDGGEQHKSENNGGETKNETGIITVVLKLDLHCDGCVTRVLKAIYGYDGRFSGVLEAKPDMNSNKVTVVGKVDPVKLRERLEAKTRKKVVLVSPQPPKGGGGDGEKQKKEDKFTEKELQLTTAVMKMNLHCDGCINRIYRTAKKTKGFLEMKVDKEKDQITVTGKMEMKALAEKLKKKMKKTVEIVPPKKEKGGGDGGGGGGEKKAVAEGKKKEELTWPEWDEVAYRIFRDYQYAPQCLSDENPNACSIM